MDNTQLSLIALIRSAIDDVKISLPFEDIDWNKVLYLSKKAQITGIIYESIKKNKIEVPKELLRKFEEHSLLQVVVDQQQEYHIGLLEEHFNKNKIDYALLKGSSIKGLYPSSFHRTMGDIDILIKLDQYDSIKELMLNLSYTEGKESNHELVWYLAPYIHIELHKLLIPSYDEDFFAYYKNGWHLMERDKGHRYKMSAENEFIYLFAHFSKHYRGKGIGIRHITDLWVYRIHNPSLDESYITNELKKLHLDRFYLIILDTIDVWFYGKEGTETTDIITRTVFQSGSFGTRERADDSFALKLSKKHKNVFTARISHVFYLIFLPSLQMKNRYPILKKAPVLIPLFWPVRWFEVIFFKRKNIKKQREKTNLITQKNIERYQKELNAVGLDFFF